MRSSMCEGIDSAINEEKSMKPELKLGRPCIVTHEVRELKGIYLDYNREDEYPHRVLVHKNGITIADCYKHVKPDLTAPPMNGDEVEYGYEGLSFEYHGMGTLCGEYINPQGIKSFAVVTEKGELRLCKHVRHAQPSKRDRVEEFLNSYYYPCNAEKIANEIDKIYTEDE